ncbi:MAG: hypothetical protein E7005_02935 [Alphaproteobacteria bacterium]|nr:hypothetical protein [Alphaproteobacteria bacterium]
MDDKVNIKTRNSENKFFNLYKIVQERESFLSNDAKIVQYNAILNFYMKFLQQNESVSPSIMTVLFWIYVKLGDIYYEEALQSQDNSKYFLAVGYYNQSLLYTRYPEERNRVLLALKDIYYYIGDEDALVKVEESWAENHNEKDKFAAYMLLAKTAEVPQIKVLFLEKALDEVMRQDESFYTKYQDTLNVCSQLIAIYELLGDNDKVKRVRDLRERTLKLLN